MYHKIIGQKTKNSNQTLAILSRPEITPRMMDAYNLVRYSIVEVKHDKTIVMYKMLYT